MTFDFDFWIDLPSRQYLRVMNLARTLGATFVRNTVVELKDGTLINFVYEVTGLRGFSVELRGAKRMHFGGEKVPVLPLERILKSKEAIRRPKDLVHIQQIKESMRAAAENEKKRKKIKK